MNLSAPTLRAIYFVALLAICGGGCRAHGDDEDVERRPPKIDGESTELKNQINAAGRELSVEETPDVLRRVHVSSGNEYDRLVLKKLIAIGRVPEGLECQGIVPHDTLEAYIVSNYIGLNIMPYVRHFVKLQLEKCWSKLEVDIEEAMAQFDNDKDATLFREKLAEVRASLPPVYGRPKGEKQVGELSEDETAKAIGEFIQAKYPEARELKFDRFLEKFNESVKRICFEMESENLSTLLSFYEKDKPNYIKFLGIEGRKSWDNWLLDDLSCRRVRGFPEEMAKLSYKTLRRPASLCSIFFNCLS